MNNNLYALNISNKYDYFEEIDKERKNIYQLLKMLSEKHTKYNNISFIIGISDVSSKDAKVVYNYNLLKGRPRKKVEGSKVDWHFHIYIIGNEQSSASSFATYVRNYIADKRNIKVSINRNDNLDNALDYVNRQCISKWTYGVYFKSKK